MGVILAAGVVTAVLGPTSCCITFTPPFVSEDFNKLNTPIALMALCTLQLKTVYSVSVTYFFIFFYSYKSNIREVLILANFARRTN